jgi:hypothetical protein
MASDRQHTEQDILMPNISRAEENFHGFGVLKPIYNSTDRFRKIRRGRQQSSYRSGGPIKNFEVVVRLA